MVSTLLGLVGIAAGLGWLHTFRQINRVTSRGLSATFTAPTDAECFTPRREGASLQFSRTTDRKRDKETNWVQCKTPNELSARSTYKFRLSRLVQGGVSADYRVVGVVGTFGVEVSPLKLED